MKILKIGAIWCKECLVMKPMWAEIEAQMPDLETEYYDADEHPEILKEYDIDNIPTFIFMDKDGKELLRLTGAQNKEELLGVIKGNLNK